MNANEMAKRDMAMREMNQQGCNQIQRQYDSYVTPRSDNAITYMRQRRKELGVKLMEMAALQKEAADIDKALAALGDEP